MLKALSCGILLSGFFYLGKSDFSRSLGSFLASLLPLHDSGVLIAPPWKETSFFLTSHSSERTEREKLAPSLDPLITSVFVAFMLSCSVFASSGGHTSFLHPQPGGRCGKGDPRPPPAISFYLFCGPSELVDAICPTLFFPSWAPVFRLPPPE